MIHTVHHVDGIAMVDRDGPGKGAIEEEFERWAMIEQRIRGLLRLAFVGWLNA